MVAIFCFEMLLPFRRGFKDVRVHSFYALSAHIIRDATKRYVISESSRKTCTREIKLKILRLLISRATEVYLECERARLICVVFQGLPRRKTVAANIYLIYLAVLN